MTDNKGIVKASTDMSLFRDTGFNDAQIATIKQSIAKGATDEQLMLFLQVCKRTGLDPFTKQIYCVVRNTKDGPQATIQSGIDSFYVVAHRTGRFAGEDPPQWCDQDGNWRDVWLNPRVPPSAARATVYRYDELGNRAAYTATANYTSFVQRDRDGNVTKFWTQMPEHQLAKCASAQALRKAFPNDLGRLYAKEEMPPDDAPPAAEERAAVAANEAQISQMRALWERAQVLGMPRHEYDMFFAQRVRARDPRGRILDANEEEKAAFAQLLEARAAAKTNVVEGEIVS